MNYRKTSSMVLLGIFISVCLVPLALAEDKLPHPNTYLPSYSELHKHKAQYDDTRPYLKTFGPKQVLPPELWEKLSYDVDEMKKAWSEVVGFKSEDLVGKIAPEIKPGKYTYETIKDYPGLKELMWPDLYNRIKPGAPPHGGTIPEFEIIPTRQFYCSLPIAQATKENMGKTKLDEEGYPDWSTWEGGYPFPRPSGKFKAQQIMYNVEKRYLAWGLNFYILGYVHGYNKRLARDFNGSYDVTHLRLAGRVLAEPFGWFDNRAQEREEFKTFVMGFSSPRDVAGAAQSALYYLDINTMDQLMMYLPSLRRIRKMSATDSQDPIMGQDQIYDDNEGWMQKLSPTRYPYTFEVIDEREYLLPAATVDGSQYISSDNLEFRNMKFERRPIYVVKLTQQDSNYVYGHRIFLIDMETFNFYQNEYYDQKGRLYRSWFGNYGWHEEMGMFSWCGLINLMRDHIDLHSGVQQPYQLPAFWNRDDVNLKGLVKRGK